MVPTTGIELVTYWLQVSCSTYWAKSACCKQVRRIIWKILCLTSFFYEKCVFFNYSSNLQAKSHILALKLITFNKKRWSQLIYRVYFVQFFHSRYKAPWKLPNNSRPFWTPFLNFSRQQWAELRKSVPLKLTEQDLKPLLGFNEELSLDEVSTIYLPLARLINYYIDENLRRQTVLNRFLGGQSPKVPYIISIAGSVAVGKSTSARILQSLLTHWPTERKVDLITTDGFLYPWLTISFLINLILLTNRIF